MKHAVIFPALFASAFAASIPAQVYEHIHGRAAALAPVCNFDARSLGDANTVVHVEKRDLKQTTWNPPSNLVTPLKQVWDHEMSTYSNPLGFMNFGYDQVMAGQGKINYCVRWDSSESVTAEQRTQVETAIRRQFNKWIAVLAGFEKFPYNTVDVNVVGWAVRDASLLRGDTSGIQVYTDRDSGGVPQCSEACGRFFHQNNDYSRCAAGQARHYDQSLWLTAGFQGGAGGDWGQRVGSEYFMQNVNADNIHIVLHELGHTFALDDFYDWTPTGVTNFIMRAGSAMEITEFDAWMSRDWWRNLKSRYGL
ncbi:hypothetical protein BU26DRAFT_565669 [Trematosphaeria pertusa]|uniref:Cellulose-binding family II protein n=1 Tax=Trematosphaeria pertusa TaxID=390896 RepID=A0A6A6ICW5_9PLEO|nr:uncharacterized protein BU26DRAFT_565669 [Trematosphaeria pertusa]KAF2248266.1 hypothetical protein BU26DRAFT_565669 [Trematosphaeria pertusa]